RESGSTIVYVTHDQEEALAMSDRICLMNHAKIEQLGTPREIYERPRTAFAADFIGISNIFRGRWDGNGSLETAHGRFSLPRGVQSPGAEPALVIRPEHLRLGAPDGNAVTGRVSEIVYAGSETRVIAALGDGAPLVLRLGPDDAIPAIDEQIVAGWARDRAVLVA
ncbi:MAG TPA: TOBE domain-containing protein, partial [Bosea sp. (in: a-proteobacteria)]